MEILEISYLLQSVFVWFSQSRGAWLRVKFLLFPFFTKNERLEKFKWKKKKGLKKSKIIKKVQKKPQIIFFKEIKETLNK
jgi:hypothetical protein